MNLSIPTYYSRFDDIDYHRFKTRQGKMTDYVMVKGGYPLYHIGLPGHYYNYWYSNVKTVRYSLYEGGGEETYQLQRAIVNYTSAFEPCGVRPTIDYDYLINNGICLEKNNKYIRYFIGKDPARGDYSIYQFGEYPQTSASEEMCLELEKLFRKDKLRKTGNFYSYVIDKRSDLISADYEYEYKGERYVRAKFTSNVSSYKWCFGDRIIDGHMWIKVEPVMWIVDEMNCEAISEMIITGPMKYNDYAKDDIEDTFIGSFLEKYLSKEINYNRNNKVFDEYSKYDKNNCVEEKCYTLDEWINWSNYNNIHPLIHMFMIYSQGIYLDKDINWIEISNRLYEEQKFDVLKKLLDNDVYNCFVKIYSSLNITVDDVLNDNVCEEELDCLSNINKYLLVTLLTLVEQLEYEYVQNFIDNKLGKKYGKYYKKLCEQCFKKNNGLFNLSR